MKRLICVILSAVILLSCFCVMGASASGNGARLYNFYGSSMLFEQNKPAVISGTASDGSVISCVLYDENGEPAASGEAVASGGTFEVSFSAPEGSYDEYTISVSENGNEFARLENVVFGELWLAAGQSNMQYMLNCEYYFIEGGEKLAPEDKWLRALMMPQPSTVGGDFEYCPDEVQSDIEGAYWISGDNPGFSAVSAVAYYFASNLRKSLDMPVGILNTALGGSTVRSWLSRETIEADTRMMEILDKYGAYFSPENWNPKERSQFYDMGGNFNTKVYPLRNFSISGMIWYQGESDIGSGWKPEEYCKFIDQMQKSYTKLFGFDDGLLPFIYAQIASYDYGDYINGLIDMNLGFSDFAAEKPDSRAMVTLYDVPHDCYPDFGSIHPAYKKPVGDRMAYAAEGMVYGMHETFSAAAVASSSAGNGAITVKLTNSGSELIFTGGLGEGFFVCGSDGVYVKAKAEIIAPDTVKISNEKVPEPVSASYAAYLSNGSADLAVVTDDGFIIPVASFVTDKNYREGLRNSEPWEGCESASEWRIVSGLSPTEYYDTWKVKKCGISFEKDSAFSGAKGLHVSAEKGFELSPMRSEKRTDFCDINRDFSKMGELSFYVRNTGSEAVELKEIRFYKNALTWYAPANTDDGNTELTIPADGEWHNITYDLNSLYLFGNEGLPLCSNDKLENTGDIRFEFASGGEIDIDDFSFATETSSPSTRFVNNLSGADNIWEYICAVFTALIALIAGK